MNGQVSALTRMFTEVWRRPPSKETTKALVAMELRSGLKADDIYAPIAIVQFRQLEVMQEVAASIRESADQHEIAQARFAQTFRDALAEMREMTQPQARRTIWRRMGKDMSDITSEASPLQVNVYREEFPMLSYLREAFARKNGVDEHDERIAAARQSLLYLLACATAIAMIGALLAAHALAR